MKIAFIGYQHSASTLPLVAELAKRGHYIDYYYCAFLSEKVNSLEAFEVDKIKKLPSISKLDCSKNRGLHFLSPYNNARVFLISQLGNEKNKIPFIGSFLSKALDIFTTKICNRIKSENYDVINIIGQNPILLQYSLKLEDCLVIHSLHEVLKNHLQDKELIQILPKIIQFKKPILVFSEKSKNDLLFHSSVSEKNIHIVPFGLFHSYNEFGKHALPELKNEENYLLFYGSIIKYKGAEVLFKAMKKLITTTPLRFKLVVAGKIYDKSSKVLLEKMKQDKHFIVIDRWLENDEIVHLIKHCRGVVCPHLSASQSGIPQTTYLFQKPIIASRVGAFNNTIINNKTGLLVPPNDTLALAQAIKELYNNDNLYHEMVSNIADYEKIKPEFSWKYITDIFEKTIYQIKKQ